MQNRKLNNYGFAHLGIVLLVIAIAVVGGTGVYVYHANHKAKPAVTVATNNSTQSTPSPAPLPQPQTKPDPYAGWKTAVLKYEKITYKYPAGWSVIDKTTSSPKGQGCVYPGQDYVVLTSPSKNQIIMRTGVDCTGDDGVAAFKATPVNSLGQNSYLALEHGKDGGQPTPTQPNFACLARTAKPTILFYSTSKNIFFNGNDSPPQNYFCYYSYNRYYYLSNPNPSSEIPNETTTSIENSKDYNTAKLIFESLRY